MTIAVTGATGHLGRLIIQALNIRVSATEVVALARAPGKVEDLGVAVREADYNRPETLAAALAGIDTLVLVSSSEIGRRIVQHQTVIDAAAAADVQRIVYTSVLRADRSALSVAEEHRATEAALRASGLEHTVLRNGWYNENYVNGIAGALASGALIGSARDGKIASAARQDYAEAAAIVATTPGHQGRTYDLAGDQAWSMQDLAREISAQSRRDIPYNDLPPADYAAALTNHGLPAGFADLLAGWDVETADGALFDQDRQLSGLIGRPTTPISRTVSDVLDR